MVIYNLEKTPDIFITADYIDHNELEYRMVQINNKGDINMVRWIDLRKDTLMIYGTQIIDSSPKRLYESLSLRPKKGFHIYVNCDGACYFVAPGDVCYKPIHNVIFDWSPFGVIVPNSVNDSLKTQLGQKEQVNDHLHHQLSCSEANLKASMEKVDELKEEISTCKKEKEDLEVKLHEVYQRRLALVDFELELYKIELDSYKKGEDELLDQICSYRGESQKLELGLQKRLAQLSSVNSELQSTKIELETSSKVIKELGYELSSCRKGSEEKERKLKKVEEEHSLIGLELMSAKNELESSNKNVKDLEEVISTYKKESKNMKIELQKVQDQLSSVNCELESSTKSIKELGFQLSSRTKESQEIESKLRRVEEEHSLISLELRSTKNELDLSNKYVKDLNEKIATYKKESKNMEIELQNIQNQLSLTNHELKSTKTMLESSRKEVNEIKDQSYSHMMEQQFVEGELHKVINQICIINSEVMTTNQKLDQVLISKLWNEVNGNHRSQPSLQCSTLPVNSSTIQANNLPVYEMYH